jgi:anhydro-N-acetylmuramic acid kinase
VVAGVLSGTSADGIDVVLFRPRMGDNPVQRVQDLGLIDFRTTAFEPGIRAELRHVLDGGQLDLGRVACLHRDLGVAFGAAAKDAAMRAGVRLDLVGSHGQTVWHHDGSHAGGRASLQLGDGDFLAEAARAAVVSDFRQGDLATGGEGAPIGHLVDPWLYPGLRGEGMGILNLGGFGNLTLAGDGGEGGQMVSFDTGPAGALLDGLARQCFSVEMDTGGERAARGVVRPELFATWMGELEPFLRTAPPRSTGRDTFGEQWVRQLIRRSAGARGEDLLATGVAVVAACVARSLEHAPSSVSLQELVLAGGGAQNPVLVQAIEDAAQVRVTSSENHGVDPDAREALIFGLLGAAHVLGIALPARVLGKLSPGPEQECSHE